MPGILGCCMSAPPPGPGKGESTPLVPVSSSSPFTDNRLLVTGVLGAGDADCLPGGAGDLGLRPAFDRFGVLGRFWLDVEVGACKTFFFF